MRLKQKLVCYIFVIFSGVQGHKVAAKDIDIVAVQTPLVQVLSELRDKYGLLLTYDNTLISKYEVTLSGSWEKPEAALKQLLRDLPIGLKKVGRVFVLYPVKSEINKSELFSFSGRIRDAATGDALPFALIASSSNSFVSDEQGRFSMSSFKSTPQVVEVNYLGYKPTSIVLTPGISNDIYLNQKSIEIEAVSVKSESWKVKTARVGDSAGKLKVNPAIADVLPGFGDNSIFNYLRLMPGIMTQSSSSGQLSIRGNFPDQNRINFDGIKLFKSWHYLEQIGIINPLLVQNIEIDKTGFDATCDNATGSLIKITGVNAPLTKPEYIFNINNTTLNLVARQPLSEKWSLVAGLRRTYYNLFEKEARSIDNNPVYNLEGDFGDTLHQNYQVVQEYVQPRYRFNDFNAKLIGETADNSTLYVNLFYANDAYELNSTVNTEFITTRVRSDVESHSMGTSVFYRRTFASGIRMNNSASFSALQSQVGYANFEFSDTLIHNKGKHRSGIGEVKLKSHFYYPQASNRMMQFGFEVVAGQAKQDIWENKNKYGYRNETCYFNGFLQEQLFLFDKLNLKAGLRTSFYPKRGKVKIDPRLELKFALNSYWKLTARTGHYHQNTVKVSIPQVLGYQNSYFDYADWKVLKPYQSWQSTGGVAFARKGTEFSAEAFYKSDKSLIYSENGANMDAEQLGYDVFAKKEMRNFTTWMSYSFSKRNLFHFQESDVWEYQLKNSTSKEFKFAAMYHPGRFTFALNYVLGEQNDGILSGINEVRLSRFSRFDVSAVCRYQTGIFNGETGISFLNIFDRKNNVFNQMVNPIGETGTTRNLNYSFRSLPFTIGIFHRISF